MTKAADQYIDELEIANDARDEGRHDAADAIIANANRPPAAELIARIKHKGRMGVEMRRRIAQAARAAQAKRSLAEFFRQAWAVLEPEVPLDFNWHHQLVCDVVQGMLIDWLRHRHDRSYRQRARNAIFNLPPGSGKSRLISVIATAWMWLHCPSWTVMCLSANPDVATRDASLCRDLVTSDWYVQTFRVTWTIRGDIDAKGKFKNTAGGERQSRGITSKVVGNRTNAILIDDPNDMYDVQSEPSRREINARFDESIFNRLNDLRSDLRFMIQQRGHEDDLTGHWMRTDPNGTLLVALPLEFDPERRAVTPWGRDPRKAANDNIHPERYTDEVVEEARRRLGTLGFEGQYNQRPGARGGNLVARSSIRFFSLPFTTPITDGAQFPRPPGASELAAMVLKERKTEPGAHWTKRLDLDWWVLSIDATFGSESESASNVGLLVWAGKQVDRFLFDDRSRPLTFPKTLDAIAEILVDFPCIKRILIENAANGAAIVQTMQHRFTGFTPFKPKGSKAARFHSVAPQYERNVYVLEGRQWVKPYIEEICLFPKTPKNDRVDASSQLLIYAEQDLTNAARWGALSR